MKDGNLAHHGCSNHEEKPWHDIVGHGDMIPRGVIQMGIGFSYLVGKNHEADCETSLYIERAQSLMRGGTRFRTAFLIIAIVVFEQCF